MSSERPISEDDLHAYVDHALDAERQIEVQAYLDRHPEIRARIDGYRSHRERLREALQPVADEPIPAELNLRRLVEDHGRGRRMPVWQGVAAAMVLLAIGTAGGWSLRGTMSYEPAGIATVAQEAADAFRVYGNDHVHPVELRAADRAQLASWVTQSLQHPVTIPDLEQAGYRFMGGRVVPTAHGAAAMFMYDDDHGTRLTMLVRQMTVDRDAAMAAHAIGDIRGFTWAVNGIGYGLVGDVPTEQLQPVANEIRRQARQKI
jgi:anti-sigma factor RsiW